MTVEHWRARPFTSLTVAALVALGVTPACGGLPVSPQPAGHQARLDTVGQVALWMPKPGKKQDFEAGYAQHLQWHARSGDTWSWHGWYVVSGPRSGLFLDATFDHAWADFDRAVSPAEDRADNARNVEPFADFQHSYRVSVLPELSIGDTRGLTAKFMTLVTLSVADDAGAR